MATVFYNILHCIVSIKSADNAQNGMPGHHKIRWLGATGMPKTNAMPIQARDAHPMNA